MINAVLIVILLIGFAAMLYRFLKGGKKSELVGFEEESTDKFSEEYLKQSLIAEIDGIIQTDYSTLNLNKYETMKNERNQDKLFLCLKTCSCGNYSSKLFVKDIIKTLLQKKLGISMSTINETIHFDDPGRMTAQDKFEILLYLYKKKFSFNAMEEFIRRNELDAPISSGSDMHFEISCKRMHDVYDAHAKLVAKLDFFDKLEILTQRCYQISYGLGAVDEIRDMIIDGLNCGTSGIPNTFYTYGDDGLTKADDGELPLTSYNAVWLMFHGKLVHLAFTGFGTQQELERVCKLIYRYDNPGTLDSSRGYIVNYTADGCRVAVARPSMGESWMFFLRKYDTASKMSIEELYPFKCVEKFIEVVHWIITGCRNVAITGEQATGKSTFLVSLVQFMAASYGIRVEEMAFELHLRKIYPKRNIATFQDTDTVSAQEGIDFQKKTDGTISIFGEIAQAAVASLAIQLGQVGAAQVVFTHHAKTAHDLIEAFRDNMIEAAGFNNEKIVEKTVSRVLNFNIHLSRTVDGLRFPERVTMIVPKKAEGYPSDVDDAKIEYYYRQTDRQLYEAKDIIVLENGRFEFRNNFDPEVIDSINSFLNEDEKKQFMRLVATIDRELNLGSGGVNV